MFRPWTWMILAERRGRGILAPTHAHPAKLVFAFLAGHVAVNGLVSNDLTEYTTRTYLQPPFFSIVL